MFIRIEKNSSTPLSRQILEQVRAQCFGGLLRPGQCLPSVRELAKQLVVNVNTVVRVYERLAAEGLVELRQGEGTFVLPPAKHSIVAAELKQQRAQFSREFQAAVRRGLLLGFSATELKTMLTAGMASAIEQISPKQSSEKRS